MWGWYLALDAGRQGGMGPSPLAWSEIEAFCRLQGVQMSARELEWIKALDLKALEIAQEARP